MRHQAVIDGLRPLGAQYLGQLVQLVAGVGDAQPAGQQRGNSGPKAAPPLGRDRSQACRSRLPQRLGGPAKLAPDPVSPEIAVVTSEQLVPGVPGQAHRHLLARQLCDQEGGNLRRIGKRLVIELRQARNHRHRLLGRHVKLGVLGAQVPRHRRGVLGFVVLAFVKADGERLDRTARLRLHQRHHRGGIDAAGQKRPQRHIGHPLQADRLVEAFFQRLHRFGFRAGKGRAQAGLHPLFQ